MEGFGVQATGLNLKAMYMAPAEQAFTAGIIKEEQNQRAKPVARTRNIGLDKAFTIMLCNILQYAPVLYAEKIFNQKQLDDFKWYEIKVP